MSASDQYPLGYLEENHGGRVMAACTIVLCAASVLFPLRFYARSLAPGHRAWDDHLLIPAYIGLLGLIACVYAEVVQAGLGKHAAKVGMEDPNKITKYLLLLYTLDWFYVPSNMLSRVSVVCMYLRIFTDKWARAAAWSVMAFLIANCVATIIAAQLECRPLAYTWDRSIEGGKCFNQILWYQVTNIPNIVGDVMILLLPVKTVWTLKASTARKAGIATVCITGSIGLIASCVRTSVFFLNEDTLNNDPTFLDSAFSWTVVECGMYFSAACLIGMRPLYGRLPSFLKTHFTRASKTGDTSGERTYEYSSDRLRLNGYRNKGEYATMEDGTDVESSLRRQQDDSDVEMPIQLAAYAKKNPFGDRNGDPNEIRVETNIEVTRIQGNLGMNCKPGHDRHGGGNAKAYAYTLPGHAE